MTKILSIIIPTYNMEELLPRCIDSLIGAGVNELIEIIVVNDGSTDSSLQIARAYQSRDPECISVIDKSNGNYGSAINAALPLAKGKYVKILDSDDWFDSDALAKFVRELSVTDVDIAVTHFNIIHRNDFIELVKYNVYGLEPYKYGNVYDLDSILSGGYIRFFLMHSLTYRTELLRRMDYRQSEGISYTDIQWSTYPFFYASNIVFYDYIVYQYNVFRDGQTINPRVIVSSLDQLCRMTYDMLDYYLAFDFGTISTVRADFLRQHYRNRLRLLAKTYLYDIPREKFNADEFAQVDERICQFITATGLVPIKLKAENKLFPLDFYAYWRKHKARPSILVESANRALDKIAWWVYFKLFK